MSGLLRNLLTIFKALFRYRSTGADSCIASHFLISPLDTGIATLKSDKYFQLAEACQLDFLIRTGLITTMLRDGISFVNASQLVKFMRPIRLFNRVRVDTAIVFADGKHAYFSHVFFSGEQQRGEVMVKMKFKKGAITVPPHQLLGDPVQEKPAHLQRWDDALEAIGNPGL